MHVLSDDLHGMQEVARTAAQLGWAGVHVLSLSEAGKAPGARRAAASTDPQQLVAQLEQLLAQNGGVHTQQTPLLLACLQVRAHAMVCISPSGGWRGWLCCPHHLSEMCQAAL